jgi:hypothetical protein
MAVVQRWDKEVAATEDVFELAEGVDAGIWAWKIRVRSPGTRNELELRRDRSGETNKDQAALQSSGRSSEHKRIAAPKYAT